MPRKAAPQMFLDQAKAQTGAALALARARILLQAFCPAVPARADAITALGELIEQLTPRGGQRPRLVFRPAPTPAKRNGHTHAGME